MHFEIVLSSDSFFYSSMFFLKRCHTRNATFIQVYKSMTLNVFLLLPVASHVHYGKAIHVGYEK